MMPDLLARASGPPTAAVTRPTFIACPNTGDLVPTGVYVTDLSNLEADNVLPFCPACGADHPWRASDAEITTV
jgi:hypothetical protein